MIQIMNGWIMNGYLLVHINTDADILFGWRFTKHEYSTTEGEWGTHHTQTPSSAPEKISSAIVSV